LGKVPLLRIFFIVHFLVFLICIIVIIIRFLVVFAVAAFGSAACTEALYREREGAYP
jgi:hypothetical protein